MTSMKRTFRAFTLIEVIATMVVVSILSAFASTIILNGTDGYFDASVSSQLHNELSISLDRIARELRKIQLDTTAPDIAPDIDTVAVSLVLWRNNLGNLNQLSMSGTDLVFSENSAPANILLSDVTAFSVRAFDEDNTMLASNLSGGACDPIRRFAVSITLTRFGVSETLSTKLFLRSTISGA